MNTTVYERLFEDLIQVGLDQRTNQTESTTRIFHHHRVQYLDLATMDRQQEKRQFFSNIAAQFRYGEMVSRIRFPGHGVIIDLGFSSDVSDTCTWMTPLVREPEKIEFTCANHTPTFF